MNDLLRKTRRAFHLLRELLKYETATCCDICSADLCFAFNFDFEN